MRLREADGVLGKQDAYPFDPRKLKVKPGYNVRDLDAPDEREALDEIKASIKERGVEEPLKVQVEGDDVFIIRGHRRHRAAMELIAEGHEVPNVLVIQVARGMNDADLNLDIIAGNDNRKDLTRLQYAEVIRRQHVVYKWDIDRIAKALGKTNGAINNALNVAELPEDVKAQVNTKLVSATEAVKVVKESRDAKTDPDFAAKLIQDAADEQKRLGKRGKATPKALKAASERAKPKPPAETKATPQVEPQDKFEQPGTRVDGTSTIITASETLAPIGEPVSGVQSLSELQQKIEGLTAGEAEARPVTQFRSDMLPHDMAADMGLAPEFSAPAEFHQIHAERTMPRPSNKIEALLVGFIAADVQGLALQYAKLRREFEETVSESGEAMQGQEELCVAADVIGQLRFPEDWENAKATTELQQVA